MQSGSLYGVPEGTPYEEWPREALLRLKDDLGRNGETPEGRKIKEKVERILSKHSKS